MPGWEPWGCRCLHKSPVTELLTRIRNSVNLPSCYSTRLICFAGSTVISINLLSGYTPKFLNFKLGNSNLCYSNSYKQCQSLLQKEEIKSKVSIFARQNKEFDKVKSAIQSKLSIFNFAHVLCLFFGGNDSRLSKIRDVHNKKFNYLGLENRYECHDPDKVILNYSSYKLLDFEKRLLAKGLNYALPPIKLNYGNYMTPFELFLLWNTETSH